jgi:hypothetical protein
LFNELDTNRYTRDADAVVSAIGKESLIIEIYKALANDLDDGFWFGEATTQELTTESGHGGLRFKVLYKIGTPTPTDEEKKSLRRIHLDISIGVDLRDVADLKVTDSIEWKIYPPEFIASEKIHCLLDRGDTKSRGKDIYDLPFIFDEVNDENLLLAMERTFKHRSFYEDSLFETAEKIDTEYITKNYDLILADRMAHTFKESWRIILEKLEKLDQLRS